MGPRGKDADKAAEKEKGGNKKDDDEEEEDPFKDDKEVNTLRALDQEYLDLEKQKQAEQIELDRKYEKLYKPVLEKRTAKLLEAPEGKEKDASVATPYVPGFWKQALKNSMEFGEFIEDYDEPVLDYLQDISYEWLEETSDAGFKLRFKFIENPFFSNNVLEKTYHTERRNEYIDQLECEKVDVEPIKWKDGKNVTVEVVSKKAKGGGPKKNKKGKKEEVSRPSFFRSFFRKLGPDEEIPEDEHGDESDDEMDLMEMLVSDDYEQGCALREFIIPHAVRWFTGEACDDEDDDDEDDEEEDAEDSDEEDDDDEDDTPPAKGRGGRGRQGREGKDKDKEKQATGGDAEKEKEECKQQ